ncbi:MAG: alpha/beta hydrolase family protein [Vitreimonas sp.]
MRSTANIQSVAGAHLSMVMTHLLRGAGAAFALCVLAACGGEARDLPVAEIDCRTGLYVRSDGHALALTPTSSGGYRWRTLEGRTGAIAATGGQSKLGWTEEADGNSIELGDCAASELGFGPTGALQAYARTPLEITDVEFEHDGLTFSGRLIWPAGFERAPLAVHVHGSESWSAVRSGSLQYLLAAQGIASFVYDKRGTGGSEGKYTQDFHVLAADARAALAQARSMAGDRIVSAGFIGGSQGGWIGPLAASGADVDFVVALYGMAVNPLQEDRYEIVQNLARAGWGEAEQAKGVALSQAAGVVIASNFREGFAEFNRLRNEYRDEPWYGDLDGEFTSEMIDYPEIGLRVIGPMRNQGTSWTYEPVPVLRALEVPQFWMLAADDTEAPPDETIARIRALQAEGRPIDLAIYPGADHGMILTERQGEGEPRETGYVSNYYAQVASWINTRDLTLARQAGADVTTPAAPATPPEP